jgi:N-acetyl-anhydromuramyl-L-alanine amidase AmpD
MAEGADPGGGLVQMVPINRNGNHAGGIPRGGYYVDAQGTRFHPNMYAVGIEIHAAGHLSKVGGKYIYEGSRIVPDEEVYTDATGRPWHLVTEYQFDVLGALLDALEAHMPRFLTVVGINPYGDHAKNGVPWASHKLFGPRLAGHATLDPINKTDPGPQVMEWLAKRYGKR